MIVAALLLLCFVTWALSHPYHGLVHDAGLYTLQALARLHPGPLAHDAFLRFGSQDAFTAFSPLYGGAIRLLGVEPAAALLTLTFQAALLAGAWLLARSVVPGRLALPGVAVLTAIPGYYGAERVFTCLEQFLTPRMAAEALVLAGIAAACRGRRWPAIALVAAAAALHPVIASAGVAALATLWLLLPWPRAGAAVALGGLVLAALLLPRIDPLWLALVQARSPYLFLARWQTEDWARCAVVLATLASGAPAGGALATSLPAARLLCRAALVTTLGGLLATAIGADLLHVALLTQLQPWRCLWLGTVVAALLLPAILAGEWQAGPAGRTRGALLLAAWLFAADAAALEAVVLLGAASVLAPRLAAQRARWLLAGACVLLGLAAVWRLASNLQFSEAYYMEPGVPLWIRRTMSFVHDGSVPALVAAGLVWLEGRRPARPVGLAACVAITALLAGIAPLTWQAWSAREFTPERVAGFAPLRAALPADAEVFLPESPLATWLLLGRPSYLSVIQTSGLVFSRPAAIEFERRAAALDPALPASVFMGWNAGGTALNPPPAVLRRACADGAVPWLATGADIGLPAVAAAARTRLYRCVAGAPVS